MKVNLYSILPAHVRYDRTLYDKSILLYGEIAAASNAYGICDESNQHFATCLGVDVRTITRCVNQLCDSGHIDRIREGNRRKFRIVQKGLELPLGVEIETDDLIPKEDITGFVHQFLGLWEKAVETTVNKKELYTNIIAQRLSSFTKDELLVALRNRAMFVQNSEWHRQPENRQMAFSIDTLLKSDESIRKWLNAKAVEEKVKVKAFNKN